MALFFIISGYFFGKKNYENIENVKSFLKRRIKSLYLPYVICNSIFILLHNFFININLYTNNPLYSDKAGFSQYYDTIVLIKKLIYTSLLTSEELLPSAIWFLKVLFFISIFFCIGSYLINKITKKYFEYFRAAICIICLLFGWFLSLKHFNFYQIGTMFSSAILFYIGVLYKKFENKINLNFITFIISFIILLFCYYHNHINRFFIGINYYNNPLWLIAASVSGFLFVLYISVQLSKISVSKKVLSYLGSRTMIILCLHVTFFKIITYLQIHIYNQPDYLLASFTANITNNFWWLAYTIIGTICPLLLREIYIKIKQYKLL